MLTRMWSSLQSGRFRLTQWLLFCWIKPTVLGIEQLNSTADEPVCYVLPLRSIADFLLVDRLCRDAGLPRPVMPINQVDEHRALFFLGHSEGLFGRRSRRRRSARLLRLFDHQTGLDAKIKIVPVSIFWGHQPDREKSIFKLILSENWTATHRVKKALAMLFHPNHIFVQYSAPVSLAELMATEADRSKQIHKLLRLLRVHFKNQRQAIIGPDLSHRRTLIDTIVSSNNVRSAIDKTMAAESGLTETTLLRRAHQYGTEIASHQSYRVIRFFHVLLSWLWHRLYDGIEVNRIHIPQKLAQSHEIVYVPCHRSHIDYLLLSYVLYHNGLAPPHIAAGINLNLPVIGALLRRGGAFFMRRSFHDDLLYKAVFDEYIHQMFIRGYSVEYFIEGGRSRTGRTLPPRTGMLAMTASSYLRDPGRPICFIPVYFGYERILEVATYMSELSGKTKKAESIIDLFRVVRSFKYAFGGVTVNFGEPLALPGFLSERRTLTDSQPPTDEEFLSICQQLARELVTRINSAAAITPVALLATALLCTRRLTMEESQLARQIDVLRTIAMRGAYGGRISVTNVPADQAINHGIDVAGLKRTEHPFGPTISMPPERGALLTYYRNNVAHVFTIPSLVARFAAHQGTTTTSEICRYVNVLYPYLKSEYLLPYAIDEVADVCRGAVGVLQQLELLQVSSGHISSPAPDSYHYAALTDIGMIIEPTLERFFIVASLLETRGAQQPEVIQASAASIAQKLSTLFGINSPTFFEKSLFADFIATLRSEGMIEAGQDGYCTSNAFTGFIAETALTLDSDLRYHVLQAVENAEVTSTRAADIDVIANGSPP
jgi:glycerol-3-phosphate O-acyltransferase